MTESEKSIDLLPNPLVGLPLVFLEHLFALSVAQNLPFL